MFSDIKVLVNKKKIDFEYVVNPDKIKIIVRDLESGSNLKIFYDENIYEVILDDKIDYSLGKAGEVYINIDNKELILYIKLKKNFLVKSVYKYINNFIDKDGLLAEIELFMNSNIGKKYRDDLNSLLKDIRNEDKSIEELIINNEDEHQRVYNLLVNNKSCLDVATKMTTLELMLLITYYICAPYVPKIDQEMFDDLVKAAKEYDNKEENIWRLGMNFDGKNYNYDLLDEFFINNEDIWYLGEYISGVIQIDKDKLVNKIIKKNDKEYIKRIVEDNFIMDTLGDKYKERLEKEL